MPIDQEGSIIYKIPDNIIKMIDYEFCKQMITELHLICKISLEDFDYDSVAFNEGTYGWNTCFVNTCRKLNKNKVFKYYYMLPWYDSDLFDAELVEELVKNKLLLPEDYINEIKRQNNINNIVVCNTCNKEYLKSDCKKNKKTDDCFSYYTCKRCLKIKKVRNVTYDKEKSIKEILNKDSSEYFLCKKCKKYQYVFHKGEQYCLSCEQEKVPNKNITKYYEESTLLNEKYKLSLVPKILEENNFKAKIKYDKKSDIFIGEFLDIKDNILFYGKTMNEIKINFSNSITSYQKSRILN